MSNQIKTVSTFQDFIATPFQGEVNAICWQRVLVGDFEEIIKQVELTKDIVEVTSAALQVMQLSAQGMLAREVLLKDMALLEAQGTSPVLNVIKCYERDDSYPLLPTDVYSYHVDRSPVPVDTILCTYFGAASDILPNDDAIQKVLIPETRTELLSLFDGEEGDEFEAFLQEYFFDLHYQPLPNAKPINLGNGHIWRLAVDHPQSEVLPCLHRAPIEKEGEPRLLLIC